ncbi:MAG: DUF1585 domain-containing protein, partial [Planctomycetota bacterium]
IRDQLKKHRETPACNDCHRKIDPLGFALENYDPVGGWRNRYPRGRDQGPLIDASGQLPNGQTFDNVVDFKRILAKRGDQFARCLTEKLLIYAMGRTLEATDRPHIDRIIDDLNKQGRGMADLVQLVVASELFKTK